MDGSSRGIRKFMRENIVGAKAFHPHLILFFSSSPSSLHCTINLRNDIMTMTLTDFAKDNPQAHISTELRGAKHPFVRATYASGKSKTVGVKNLSSEEVEKQVAFLRNQKGFKVCVKQKPLEIHSLYSCYLVFNKLSISLSIVCST